MIAYKIIVGNSVKGVSRIIGAPKGPVESAHRRKFCLIEMHMLKLIGEDGRNNKN